MHSYITTCQTTETRTSNVSVAHGVLEPKILPSTSRPQMRMEWYCDLLDAVEFNQVEIFVKVRSESERSKKIVGREQLSFHRYSFWSQQVCAVQGFSERHHCSH